MVDCDPGGTASIVRAAGGTGSIDATLSCPKATGSWVLACSGVVACEDIKVDWGVTAGTNNGTCTRNAGPDVTCTIVPADPPKNVPAASGLALAVMSALFLLGGLSVVRRRGRIRPSE